MAESEDRARAVMAERVAVVRERFVAGLADKVEGLTALARAAAGPDAAAASAAADSLRLGLHNLAGGAPTLGLTEIGRTAAALERRMIAARLADGRLPEAAAERLARDIAALPRS